MEGHTKMKIVKQNFLREFILKTAFFFFSLFIPSIGYLFWILILGPSFLNPTNTRGFLFLQIIFFFILIIIIIQHIRLNYPIYNVEILISDLELSISIRNQIYKKFIWNEINSIEISREFYGTLYSDKFNYKIKIIKDHTPIDVRLYLLRFKRRKMEMIIDLIKSRAEKFNKQIIEIEQMQKVDEIQQINERIEIENFKKNI